MYFHPTTQKSENFFPMGSFRPKYTRFELQKYIGVIFHDIEQWCKIWINPDLVVSKMAWEKMGELSLEHSKKSEKLYFHRLLLSKAVSARKFHENYVS